MANVASAQGGKPAAAGQELSDLQMLVRLTAYLRPHWLRLLLSIALLFARTGTVVIVPWLVKWAVDSYIGPEDISGLNLLMVLFVVVGLGQFATHYLQAVLLAYVSRRVLYALRVTLFGHLQRLSMSYYDRNESGKVMSRIQNDVEYTAGFFGLGVYGIVEVVALLGITAAMFALSPQLLLFALVLVPIYPAVLGIWRRYSRNALRRALEIVADLNSELQETISGIRVVQSLNREVDSERRLADLNRQHRDAHGRHRGFQAGVGPISELIPALWTVVIVVVGGRMVADGSLEVGVLIAFVLYIETFSQPFRSLTWLFAALQSGMVAAARVFEVLEEEPEVKDKRDAVELPRGRGEVRFDSVGFRYSAGLPVLQDIDLHIVSGETVALVGPTGTGKTTIVSLLLRLYDVVEGRITVDGHDVRDVTRQSLVNQMSIVLQEPHLVSGTVKENIRYNHAAVTDEQVVQAAKAVGADEFIMRMERGYDSPLQERGGNLSVGQRQLIAFARARAADPRILILDEATAYVDTQTERTIQQALKELLRDRTALVIAHRLSTVRNADRIVVIDQGRIIEQGSHEQLMVLGGLYARLQSYVGEGVP